MRMKRVFILRLRNPKRNSFEEHILNDLAHWKVSNPTLANMSLMRWKKREYFSIKGVLKKFQ